MSGAWGWPSRGYTDSKRTSILYGLAISETWAAFFFSYLCPGKVWIVRCPTWCRGNHAVLSSANSSTLALLVDFSTQWLSSSKRPVDRTVRQGPGAPQRASVGPLCPEHKRTQLVLPLFGQVSHSVPGNPNLTPQITSTGPPLTGLQGGEKDIQLNLQHYNSIKFKRPAFTLISLSVSLLTRSFLLPEK